MINHAIDMNALKTQISPLLPLSLIRKLPTQQKLMGKSMELLENMKIKDRKGGGKKEKLKSGQTLSQPGDQG